MASPDRGLRLPEQHRLEQKAQARKVRMLELLQKLPPGKVTGLWMDLETTDALFMVGKRDGVGFVAMTLEAIEFSRRLGAGLDRETSQLLETSYVKDYQKDFVGKSLRQRISLYQRDFEDEGLNSTAGLVLRELWMDEMGSEWEE